MFKYKDIYFELVFRSENLQEDIPDNETIKDSWNSTLYNCYDYNEDVDIIGNKYYYLKKILE